MRRSLAAVVSVIGLAAAACNGGGESGADPTVPTAPPTSSTAVTTSTTPTTAVPDIATIPPVIDAAYMNRVLAALDKVDTAAVRVVMETRTVPPAAAELFNSIYADESFSVKVDSWLSALQRDPDLKGLRRPLGDRHTTVERFITNTPTCVWMAVKRDYTRSDVAPPPTPRIEFLALKPLDANNDPRDHNATAWMITADGTNVDGSEPANQCP